MIIDSSSRILMLKTQEHEVLEWSELVSAPFLVKCSAQTSQKSSKALSFKLQKTNHLHHNTNQQDSCSNVDWPTKIICSSNSELHKICSAACYMDRTYGRILWAVFNILIPYNMFPADFSMPMKEAIPEMCSTFGDLDESETEVCWSCNGQYAKECSFWKHENKLYDSRSEKGVKGGEQN